MGVKRRKSKRKAPLSDTEAAWLVGDGERAGFTEFLADDYLQHLWDEHGEPGFTWRVGMRWPVAVS
jgi:hypothetical protein